MPYYEVANLVTVTKKNMIDEMPCAYVTLGVASGPIYILLMYPMNQFTYGRQFYDLMWSLALVNASIEHGLKVAGSCPLTR